MKILIPVLGFGKAGGYRVLSSLASHFVSKGHEVHFLSPMQDVKPYFPTNAEIIYVSLFGKSYRELQKGKSVKGFAALILSATLGLWRIRRQKFDVVIANHSSTVFPIVLSQVKGKRYYYIQAYEPNYYEITKGFSSKILRLMSTLSYRLNFKHIVNSELYSGFKGIQNAPVVYPGLDLKNYFRKEFEGARKTKWRIGTVGRIEPQKGTKYILEAFAEIENKYQDVELVLAFGDESCKGNNITIERPDGDYALAAFYRSIDVYICAGTVQHGAVHYPVLEAMASGTSVITTPYYPADEKNSYIVEPYSASSIVYAFEQWRSDETERQEKIDQAIECVQQFSWEHVGDKFLKILGS